MGLGPSLGPPFPSGCPRHLTYVARFPAVGANDGFSSTATATLPSFATPHHWLTTGAEEKYRERERRVRERERADGRTSGLNGGKEGGRTYVRRRPPATSAAAAAAVVVTADGRTDAGRTDGRPAAATGGRQQARPVLY